MAITPECTYNDALHQYKIGGHIVPGVTGVVRTVLAPMPVFTGKRKDIMDRAMLFGSAVHKATELWDKGKLNLDLLAPALVAPLNSWREFREEHPGEIVENEKIVFSIRYRFGGRLDRLINLKWGLTLVDIKTGAEDPAFGPQTGGYKIAASEYLNYKIKKRLVVMLGERYEPKELKDPMDEQVFLQALTCYNWRKKHGREQGSYSGTGENSGGWDAGQAGSLHGHIPGAGVNP